METTGTPCADLYLAHDHVDLVDVPEQLTVHLDGGGPLDGPEFAAAARVLYGVSHAAHFLAKSVFGHAPVVRPLEALWWRPAGAQDWSWRAFVTQPDPIDEALLEEVLDRASRPDSPLRGVAVGRWQEGLSVQVLDAGGRSDMPPLVGLHYGIAGLGYRLRGRHHEIYLADPRRTPPHERRTILRQPVALDALAG